VGNGAWAVGNGKGGGLGQGKLLLRINSGIDKADLSHGVSHAAMLKGGGCWAVGRKGSNHLCRVHLTPAGAVHWGRGNRWGSRRRGNRWGRRRRRNHWGRRRRRGMLVD
jgi:hypothetical protein